MSAKDELIKKAKYVLFPCRASYSFYGKYPETLVKFPLIEGSLYGTYKLNEHHFKPFYFKDYVLPMLEEVLHMGYNENDFEYVLADDNGFDISHLDSKHNFKFDIYSLTHNEEIKDADFSELRNCHRTESDLVGYHRLFIHPHACCRIINKTIDNNRVLVISCDSHMIPIIPVLSCYFKEIWVLDNRNNGKYVEKININDVTDVLIAGGFSPEWKFLDTNFK